MVCRGGTQIIRAHDLLAVQIRHETVVIIGMKNQMGNLFHIVHHKFVSQENRRGGGNGGLVVVISISNTPGARSPGLIIVAQFLPARIIRRRGAPVPILPNIVRTHQTLPPRRKPYLVAPRRTDGDQGLWRQLNGGKSPFVQIIRVVAQVVSA